MHSIRWIPGLLGAVLLVGAFGPAAAGEAPTALEIYLDRVQKIEERIGEEIDRLPKGWLALRSTHFVCLSEVDKQHTRYVLNFAEEIRRYLEKNFDVIGEDEVPPGLIRVFATNAAEQAYLQGTRAWWNDEVGEVTLTFGRDRSILAAFSALATRLTDQYFRIKSENLEAGLPGWLRAGIRGHIAWARPSKRKKMILAPTPGTRRALQMLLAEGAAVSLHDLLTTPDASPGTAQAESVVYWLLGRGNRGKVKNALARYLFALDSAVLEEARRFDLEEDARWREEKPTRVAGIESAEEREAAEDARYRAWRERRKEVGVRLEAKWASIREHAVEEAFGHLQEKDWKRLDNAWKKAALR